MRNLPASKINKADLDSCLASEGCIITNSKVHKSVIGVRSVINDGCDFEGVIMMGAEQSLIKMHESATTVKLTFPGKHMKTATTVRSMFQTVS